LHNFETNFAKMVNFRKNLRFAKILRKFSRNIVIFSRKSKRKFSQNLAKRKFCPNPRYALELNHTKILKMLVSHKRSHFCGVFDLYRYVQIYKGMYTQLLCPPWTCIDQIRLAGARGRLTGQVTLILGYGHRFCPQCS